MVKREEERGIKSEEFRQFILVQRTALCSLLYQKFYQSNRNKSISPSTFMWRRRESIREGICKEMAFLFLDDGGGIVGIAT